MYDKTKDPIPYMQSRFFIQSTMARVRGTKKMSSYTMADNQPIFWVDSTKKSGLIRGFQILGLFIVGSRF